MSATLLTPRVARAEDGPRRSGAVRLARAALLVWLAPAILAVLIVGGIGLGLCHLIRILGLDGAGRGARATADSRPIGRDGPVPRAPHLAEMASVTRPGRPR